MFNKEKIIKIINEDGFFIDSFIFDAFIKNWKIDPIYEDEKGVEYYDELTVEKIKKGISQKGPSKCDIQVYDKDEIKPVDMAVEAPAVEAPAKEEGEEEIPAAEVKKIDQIEKKPQPEFEEIIEAKIKEKAAEEKQEHVVEAEVVEIPDIVDLPNDLPVKIQQEVEGRLQNLTVDISNQTLALLAESIAQKITADVAKYIKETNFVGDTVQLAELKKDNEVLVGKLEETVSDNKVLVEKIEELEDKKGRYIKLFGRFYIKK